jgi:hypothetical protein
MNLKCIYPIINFKGPLFTTGHEFKGSPSYLRVETKGLKNCRLGSINF